MLFLAMLSLFAISEHSVLSALFLIGLGAGQGAFVVNVELKEVLSV